MITSPFKLLVLDDLIACGCQTYVEMLNHMWEESSTDVESEILAHMNELIFHLEHASKECWILVGKSD